MNEIEETNIKWLEYMNVKKRTKCPKGHELIKYKSKSYEWIITCPKGDCEYYDYNTYKIKVGIA